MPLRPSLAPTSHAPSGERSALVPNDGSRLLLLLRGLPSSGKSTRARELVAEAGVVFEFDEYFTTRQGFEWSSAHLDDAREWHVERVQSALEQGLSPIVLDDDNGLGRTTRRCVRLALAQGYRIEFREPSSPWWQEIRRLLADKHANRANLERWAAKLAGLNRSTHRVSAASILRRMQRWQTSLTVEALVERASASPHSRA